jgi:xylulokinase
VFVGLTWRHRREHMYRALLESVAYEYAGYLEAARRLDPATEPAEVRVIGGGAASRLWTQIKADVLGVPFSVMEDSNYTCWGAALSAGLGVGAVDDLAGAARAAARVRAVIEPDPASAEAYGELVAVYRDLYGALEGPFRSLWERRQKESQRAGL